MKIRQHGVPKSAPTFKDLEHGGLFLNDGELCVKCQDIGTGWAGFMFMNTGNVFLKSPDHFAPAPGEWVVSNEVEA